MKQTLIRNRYELRSQLGQGGMGVVYAAHDRLTGDLVALKRVVRFSDSPDGPLQLAHEFQLLASLRHPHIISVLDYGFDEDGVPFFTMNLLEGHQTITEAAVGRSIEDRIELLVQFFEALAYLHRRRILHRDLKPNNVLVLPNGQVKVVDFGVAMVDRQSHPKVAGTLLYMPPEVLQDQPPTHLSDLYSAGVLAYEVLTGDHPYGFESVTDLLSAILSTEPDLARLPAVADAPTDNHLHDTVQLRGTPTVDLDLFPTGSLSDMSSTHNPLQVIINRLMQKDPAARYQSASLVIDEWRAAQGRPTAPETAAVRDSYLQAADFVGRNDELDLLLVGLEGILSAHPTGRAFLIGGESGVGKSRLLDELRVRALVKGAEVVVGRGAATGGTRYNYWSDAVRRLLLSTPVSDVEAGVLQELVPDIEGLIGRTIVPPPPTDAPAAQHRLKEMIVTLFQRQTMPTVLILEDLHWAVESLSPLKELSEGVKDYPLLVIGTYRNDERPDLPTDLPAMNSIILGRFGARAMRALSTSMLGEVGGRSDVLAFLQRETEGNAFFIVETIRALAQEAGRLRDIGRLPLPERIQAGGIHAILQRRLESVPPAYRPLLNVAAIHARQFDLAVLAAVWETVVADNALATTGLEDWLTACADAAVIEVKDGNWQFVHEKLRTAIVESIPPDQRRRLHRHVAAAMERTLSDPEKNATPLLRQWQAAGDVEKEAHYTLIAARQNFAASEFAVAISQAQRVIDILPDTPHYAPQLIEALHVLGVAYSDSGELDAAQTVLTTALSKARALDDARLLATSLTELGSLLTSRDQFSAAMVYLQEAVERAEQQPDRQVLATAISALGTAYHEQGLYQAAILNFKRSLDLCRALDYKWGIARTLNNMGNVYIAQENAADAKRCYVESLALWREMGSRRGIASVTNNLGVVTETLGEYDEASRYYADCLRLSREHGDALSIAISLINLAWMLMMQDRFLEARQYLVEALRRSSSMGIEVLQVFAVLGLGWAQSPLNPEKAAQWYGMLTQHPAADTTDHHFSDVHGALTARLGTVRLNEEIARGIALDFADVVRDILEP